MMIGQLGWEKIDLKRVLRHLVAMIAEGVHKAAGDCKLAILKTCRNITEKNINVKRTGIEKRQMHHKSHRIPSITGQTKAEQEIAIH